MSAEAAERELLATRREFPTLAKGVHLISHSLGAMPAAGARVRNPFLDEWENESITSWHEWLPAVRELGDLVAARHRRRSGTVAMLPNVSIVQAVVASCFDFRGPRNRDRLRRPQLLDRPLRLASAGAPRRRAVRRQERRRDPPAHRGAARGDRRADAPRPNQPRALPFERDVRREARHRSRARDGRDGAPRFLPVGGDGAAQARRVGLRHRVRRLGEVGVRRARRGVPLRAAGPASRSSGRWRPGGSATPSPSRSTWGRCGTRRTRGE